MIKIPASVKVVASEEAEAKAKEDLEKNQPTEDEAKKIIGSYLDEQK